MSDGAGKTGMPGSGGLLWKAFGILLPFLFLLFVEMLLRVGGYGDNPALFIDDPLDEGFLVLNPAASRKYFVDDALATTGNAELFRKEKDPHTLRIFVLGESTTIGYPYFHNASFHRLIQYRLMNTFPGKQIEIINLALTAVNSYAVLDFAKSLPQYAPDAVLIYCGDNEYYGALGVASTEHLGNSPWVIDLVLKLREFRLVQWMTDVYAGLSRTAPRDSSMLMKQMVGNEQIEFGSDLYRQGIAQFERNMDETLRHFEAHGIPVFVSNLVSNEADIKPFNSVVDTVRYPLFAVRYGCGVDALAKGDSARAYAFFQSAQAIDDQHARCNYYLGRLALGRRDAAAAKPYLRAARDLDGLRLRAPSALNDVIAKLCKVYPHAYLVDAQAAFERRSAGGVVGDGLMLEHVHPNLLGYAVLSDAFYQAIKARKIFTAVYEREMSFDELVAAMPVSGVDSLAGLYHVARLKQHWPFNEAKTGDTVAVKTYLEKLAWRLSQQRIDWQAAMDSVYAYDVGQGALGQAERVMEGMVLEHPTEPNYWERAALISAKAGNKDKAIAYFERAFDLSPTFEKARYLLVQHLQMDKPFEALPYINYSIRINQSVFSLQMLKDQVEDVIQSKELLRSDSTNLTVISHIARAYLNMDNLEGAHKYAEWASAIDARNAEVVALLVEIDRRLHR